MDNFVKAYIEAALWSSTGDDDEPLDKTFTVEDIPSETRATIEADCEKFRSENKADLAAAYALYDIKGNWSAEEQAGHDFWLTRNGHGSGFWSRGIGEVGKRLTEASNAFGECYLYVGDDGKLYI